MKSEIVVEQFNIECINEILTGEAIRRYREHFNLSVDSEPLWFTIIYVDSGKYKSLHLVAQTLQLFNIWVDNLEKLHLHRRDIIGGLVHLRKRQYLWLEQQWKQADKDGNSRLDFDDVARLCCNLNINMPKSLLETKFKDGQLDFTDFQQFVKLINQRVELDKLFNSLAKEHGNTLTLREFKDFLVNIQKYALKEEECDNLYYKFCEKGHKEMNLEGFSYFLMSSDNAIFASEHTKIYQDMTQPLSHYFIDSSHNTYLIGNQLTSQSSVEGYIQTLQRGCRCVEIDCWDGPDGPIVTHGYTLTSKIMFQDVISTIRTYAFTASPYPLILSLEVHCSIDQQNQMASILRNTLGEHLVTNFISENETELPSPTDLLYKIILKIYMKFNTRNREKEVPKLSEEKGTKAKRKNIKSRVAQALSDLMAYFSTVKFKGFNNRRDILEKETKAKHKKTKLRVAQTLSDLMVYCSAVKFKGFDYHRGNPKYYQMCSFTDNASSKLIKSERDALIQHNTRQLTRIYPGGFRINSSNYEPHHQWMVGNQLVSLNWQNFDLGMQIDYAMFSVNGRCGYVLKPERLCNPKITYPTLPPQTLTIEIISAQHLPKLEDDFIDKIIDPFVEVELLIPGADAIKKRTSTISDNGFNPIWNETLKFTFNCNEMSLVFLRFVIWDHDIGNNDFIASYCIPITSLQFGYRYVPLNDLNGEQYLNTTLFIRSSLE
ncbi:15029_t:CDS:10 [Cetraspora pellucida]|uniref:Phosphoinositide phospholipase C n=1 Tax=Cetraspora pellucida TaxID=1433469 RepID=A0A9N9H094_9GLOM|nr:15029_t:CDS:10 [Cetraspora pellucida]